MSTVQAPVTKQHRRSSKRVVKQEWPCPFAGCNVVLFSKSSQFRHRRLHDSSLSKYKCSQCSENFAVKLDLMDHTRRAHMPAGSYVICQNCDRTFSSLSNLNAHSGIHKDSGVPRYQCSKCSMSYFHRSALRRHQRADHNMISEEGGHQRRSSISSVSSQESLSMATLNNSPSSTSPEPVVDLAVTCKFCTEVLPDNPRYHFHLEEKHFISSDHRCLINACGEFCGNGEKYESHKKDCHPFFI
ncbi:hypothetical protein BC833DRAFT_574644 [Globomyces pollinis-pini]|nr:hypothetical protein BC833DRAFT_574644 [Globomyces pollinis-pini]KAJ3000486.1 hypothetical protein HDV02_005351 [Globomyces sp. JEL0801]